jgi:hypothetical protein
LTAEGGGRRAKIMFFAYSLKGVRIRACANEREIDKERAREREKEKERERKRERDIYMWLEAKRNVL